ncbi:MAG TPA: AAA family ATPase [Pirellulales bacterium]|jgi:general secretion pathway protein A|nr:AAA family ATPase [Pirellulales bacterium]
MYCDYWGFSEKPFPEGVDPARYSPSPTHEEALARLHFLAEGGRRFGLLLAANGSGKSLLLEIYARQLRFAGCQVAQVSLLGLEPRELVWRVAADWGLNPDYSATTFELWRAIDDRLAENAWQDVRAAALFDDVDDAAPDALDQVARLCHASPASKSKLTLVAAGRSERVSFFGRRLLELADLRIDILPWDLADTEDFLTKSLGRAGRTSPAFTADAVLRLHELSGGIVRRLSQLADLALVAAAAARSDLVDAHTIESVHDELGVVDALAPLGAGERWR